MERISDENLQRGIDTFLWGCETTIGATQANYLYHALCELRERRAADNKKFIAEKESECKTCLHNDACQYNPVEDGEEAFEKACVGCPCGDGTECNAGNGTCNNYEYEGDK